MELDELKLAWNSLDRRIATQNAMAFLELKEQRTSRARSSLRPLVIGQFVQLVAGVLLCVPAAQFWVAHMDTPHLLLCGLLVHAYAVMLIAFAVRELTQVWAIDYSAPVLQIQKRIAALRAWRVRIAPIFGATGCVIWIPLLLMIFQGLGVDVWQRDPMVVYWFIASGLVPLAAMAGFMLWLRQPKRRALAERMDASTVGRSLQRAQSALAEIAAFEQESAG